MRRFQSLKRLGVISKKCTSVVHKNFSNVVTATQSNDVGLFGCEGLITPADFIKLSNQSRIRIDELLHLIENVSPSNKGHAHLVLYLLDSISNEICTVVDAAEVCRNIHNDSEFKHAAEVAFTEITSRIYKLNANDSIYAIIKRLYEDDYSNKRSVVKTENDPIIGLSSEESMFLNDLKIEFECEGILLPQLKKKTLHQLQNDIVSIETAFLTNASLNDNQIFPLKPVSKSHTAIIRNWISNYVQIDKQHMNDPIQNIDDNSVLCSSNKRISLSLMKSLEEEESRKNLYYQTCFEPFSNLSQLGNLIVKRRELGELLNYKSYSHKFLLKQAMKTPEQVMSSLQHLSRVTRNQAEQELESLRALKFQSQRSNTLASDIKLYPWDISFYSTMHSSIVKEKKKRENELKTSIFNHHHHSSDIQQITSYLSLKHCLKGLVMITNELFNVEFIQAPFMPHESWNGRINNINDNRTITNTTSSHMSDWLSSFSFVKKNNNNNDNSRNVSDIDVDSLITGIFKFNVYKGSSSSAARLNEEDKIGTVYLDLFERPIGLGHGKLTGSAMFTVAGGCRKSYHEQKIFKYSDNIDILSTDILKSLPYQLPRVAMVLNIQPPSSSSSSSSSHHTRFSTTTSSTEVGPLLKLHEVETLHHEWGHMLHSLLSRTAFQHLSGTRTSMDFSEVPSHLFEYFARTPSVVREWARHWKTEERLPDGLLEEALSHSGELKALDLQSQILYSAADQYIFGSSHSTATSGGGSSGHNDIPTPTTTLTGSDAFWSTVPGICILQQSLTCLPLAPNPAESLQVIIDQRIGMNHLHNPSSSSSASDGGNLISNSYNSYNTANLMSIKRDIERHGITHLPAMMPCSHNHYVNYGAGYYSYLFARMYAAQIWERKFSKNPLSRESGRQMLESLLQHGASKDPQLILDTMADGPLDPTYFIKTLIGENSNNNSNIITVAEVGVLK